MFVKEDGYGSAFPDSNIVIDVAFVYTTLFREPTGTGSFCFNAMNVTTSVDSLKLVIDMKSFVPSK